MRLAAPAVQPAAAVSPAAPRASSSASEAVSRRSMPRAPGRPSAPCSDAVRPLGRRGAAQCGCAVVRWGVAVARMAWPRRPRPCCRGRPPRRQPQRQRLADRPGLLAAVDDQALAALAQRPGPRPGRSPPRPGRGRAPTSAGRRCRRTARRTTPPPGSRTWPRSSAPYSPVDLLCGCRRRPPARSPISVADLVPDALGARRGEDAELQRLRPCTSTTCWTAPSGLACSRTSTPSTAGICRLPRSSRGRSPSGASAMSYGPNSGGACLGSASSARRVAGRRTPASAAAAALAPRACGRTSRLLLRCRRGQRRAGAGQTAPRARRWSRARPRRATVSGSSSTTWKSARSTRCTTSWAIRSPRAIFAVCDRVVVDQVDQDLAAVAGVDRTGRVEHRDAEPGGQTRSAGAPARRARRAARSRPRSAPAPARRAAARRRPRRTGRRRRRPGGRTPAAAGPGRAGAPARVHGSDASVSSHGTGSSRHHHGPTAASDRAHPGAGGSRRCPARHEHPGARATATTPTASGSRVAWWLWPLALAVAAVLAAELGIGAPALRHLAAVRGAAAAGRGRPAGARPDPDPGRGRADGPCCASTTPGCRCRRRRRCAARTPRATRETCSAADADPLAFVDPAAVDRRRRSRSISTTRPTRRRTGWSAPATRTELADALHRRAGPSSLR